MGKQLSVFLTALVVIGGCASMRGVSVGSDKSTVSAATSYQLAVHNTRSSSIVVSWQSSSGTQALGTVTAGDTKYFTITGGTAGSVRAVTSGGTTLGTKSVTLGADTKTVTF